MKPFLSKATAFTAVVLACCTSEPLDSDSTSNAGAGGDAGTTTGGSNGGTGGNGGGAPVSGGPRYHPPTGFEDCIHAEVKEDCSNGWCRLPASCFVMGSPDDEPFDGENSEIQTRVHLTNSIRIQQTEMTRGEWRAITKTDTKPDSILACLEDNCPVTMVTWWEAIHAANLLSEQEGLAPCYRPVGCMGTLGRGLTCEDFENPLDNVYDCEGYRLPTQAESEYAVRAGTITPYYSGDINPKDGKCEPDANLAKIGWFCANSSGKTHPVKELAPNEFGLYDQLGNVQEWLQDVEYYASSPGGENPRGEFARKDSRGKAEWRMLRGGRVDTPNFFSRAAARSSSSWSAYERYSAYIGFRLVRTLPPGE